MQVTDTQHNVLVIQAQLVDHEDRLNTVRHLPQIGVFTFMMALAKKADSDHPKEFLILSG